MSEVAQQRHGFTVGKLPDFSTLNVNPLAEALTDNMRTPPPDAAAFRLDFPRWKRRQGQRDRRIIHDMLLGHGTKAIARKHQLSESRISQMRRELKADWDRWCEPPAEQPCRVA